MATVDAVFEVSGKTITEADVIARAKVTGAYSQIALELARDAAAAKAADDFGVSVKNQELQEAYDNFRRGLELHKADDTQKWLEGCGLGVDDVESYLEAGLLRGKIASQLVTDEQVDSYYAQNPSEFEFARVSHIVIKDKAPAEEIALSLKEEGEDFGKLAKTHSIDESSKCGGGYRGMVTRDDTLDLPDNVADQVFSAKTGEIVGPFQSGDAWCIVRVEECGRLPLGEELRESIRATLCEDTLAERSGV